MLLQRPQLITQSIQTPYPRQTVLTLLKHLLQTVIVVQGIDVGLQQQDEACTLNVERRQISEPLSQADYLLAEERVLVGIVETGFD
jgi:hypothetical protein